MMRFFDNVAAAMRKMTDTTVDLNRISTVPRSHVWGRIDTRSANALQKSGGLPLRHVGDIRREDIQRYVASNTPQLGYGGCINHDKTKDFYDSNRSNYRESEARVLFAIPKELISVPQFFVEYSSIDDSSSVDGTERLYEEEYIAREVVENDMFAMVHIEEFDAFIAGVPVTNLLSEAYDLPNELTKEDVTSPVSVLTWLIAKNYENVACERIQEGVLDSGVLLKQLDLAASKNILVPNAPGLKEFIEESITQMSASKLSL